MIAEIAEQLELDLKSPLEDRNCDHVKSPEPTTEPTIKPTAIPAVVVDALGACVSPSWKAVL